MMDAFLHQFRISLRLHFRNRMALIYSYLFPTIFLIAFWVLYRYDRVPLARHMGELLTVTALGGACFGLPTTMVSERERGVWRRYRLAPVRTGILLASTVAARYVLLVVAGLLQVALAMAVGMPLPSHPLDLWIAFSFVAFALLGLGLVIATLADNVPAVQALGQCIFLPMLIIGGVAVQLSSLPEWAQHVSAFFPGRYAVEAMQSSVTGQGLRVMGFSLLALLLIGLAGFVAGIKAVPLGRPAAVRAAWRQGLDRRRGGGLGDGRPAGRIPRPHRTGRDHSRVRRRAISATTDGIDTGDTVSVRTRAIHVDADDRPARACANGAAAGGPGAAGRGQEPDHDQHRAARGPAHKGETAKPAPAPTTVNHRTACHRCPSRRRGRR